MRKRLYRRIVVGVVLGAALVGCGDADTDSTDQERVGQGAAPSVTASADPPSTAVTQTQVPAAAATTAPPLAEPQVVAVKAGDYYFEPTEYTVRPGTVSVQFTNAGPERPHTFAVKNKSGDGDLFKSERVAVGATQTLEFAVPEEGTYQLYCSLMGHADRGQTGTLTVRRTAAAAPSGSTGR